MKNKSLALIVFTLALGVLAACMPGSPAAHPSPSPSAPAAQLGQAVVTGILTKVEANDLKLKIGATESAYRTDGSTTYQQTTVIQVADLKPGLCASAAGAREGAGITARTVQAQNAPATGCPVGAPFQPSPLGTPGAVASVAGKISAVGSDSITLEQPSGQVRVTVPTSARITLTLNLQRKDLKTGECLRLTTASDPKNGGYTVRRVAVVPIGGAACAAALGQGGGLRPSP